MKHSSKSPLLLFLVCVLLAGLFAGCAGKATVSEDDLLNEAVEVPEEAYLDECTLEFLDIEDEAVALAEAPAAIDTMLTVSAPGTKEKKGTKATIDYSNTADGYVMVQYTASTEKKLKVQVKGPTTTYTYNIEPQKWVAFPFSDGNGSYTVAVYENASGTKYANVLSQAIEVKMTDEFAPFLRPNQYVDYSEAVNVVAKAAELTEGMSDPLEKVGAVYEFVVTTMSYDKELAQTVKSGYLPDLEKVLEKQKGICFDYAALMTGMLRSQGVPCKLVIGYAGTAYHAWISVYSETAGWVEGAVYFDGTAWQRMDPTFASSGKQSESIMKYIGDGKNYTAKYFY